MTLLNKKEDVTDIQLTSHGKYLLMKGEFNPEYCAFFDDEIVYTLPNEQQNDIKNRLLEKALTFAASPNLLSKDKTLKQMRVMNVDNNYSAIINTEYNLDTYNLPLGTSKISSDYTPAWNLKVLNGIINETNILTNKTEFNLNDFYYHVNLEQKTLINTIETPNYSSLELNDGKYLTVSDDYLLLDISELNVENSSDNFEIEVFEVLSEDDKLSRLVFHSKPEQIVDGIYLDDSEIPSYDELPELSQKFVQHYFDVLVDNEIDKFTIQNRTKEFEKNLDTYRTNVIPNAPVKDDC